MTWNAKIIDDSFNSLLLPANPKPYIENSNRSENGTRQVNDYNRNMTLGDPIEAAEAFRWAIETMINKALDSILVNITPLHTGTRVINTIQALRDCSMRYVTILPYRVLIFITNARYRLLLIPGICLTVFTPTT